MEGRTAGHCRVIDVARDDVVTCGPAERARDVRDRVRAGAYDIAVVVNDGGVVLGVLDESAWQSDPAAEAGDLMRGGPPTMKPDVYVHDVIDELRGSSTGRRIVTWHGPSGGGRLVGVLFVDDVELTLADNERR